MRMRVFRYLFLVILLVCGTEAWAQFDQERFGKNRVQHKEFKWYFYTSANFEVYYYDKGGVNAKMAIEFLESEFNKLTQNIGYVAYTKPRIYIYNSPEERLQSNLDLNALQYTEEGQTKFTRLVAEVAYKGRMDQFKEDLLFATSKVIVKEMLYGASVADAFQANLVSNFPDWYVDGIALYLAKGWSREMDDYIRRYLKNTPNPKLHTLTDLEAGLVGQSIWNYISEKYGRRYVSSILNLSRINRNEENSIANTIGINIKTFISDWQQFYLKVNEPVYSNFKTVGVASTATVGLVLGLGLAVFLGYAIYNRTVKLDLAKFFTITGVALVIIAAGVLSYGIHEFQELGYLPGVDSFLWDVTPWIAKESLLGSLLGGLVGFDTTTSFVQFIGWSIYLLAVLIPYLSKGKGAAKAKVSVNA